MDNNTSVEEFSFAYFDSDNRLYLAENSFTDFFKNNYDIQIKSIDDLDTILQQNNSPFCIKNLDKNHKMTLSLSGCATLSVAPAFCNGWPAGRTILLKQENTGHEDKIYSQIVLEKSFPTLLLSKEGVILWANPEVYTLTGADYPQLIQTPFTDLIVPSDRKKIKKYLSEKRNIKDETGFQFQKGRCFRARVDYKFTDPSTGEYSIVSIVSSAEEFPLNLTYESIHTFLNKAPALVAVGTENHLVYGNSAFLNHFNVDNIEAFNLLYNTLGKHFTERKGYFSSRRPDWLTDANNYDSLENHIKVMMYSLKDKQYRTFVFAYAPIEPAKNIYIFLLMDITDIDNYHIILKDVNYILEQEMEKQYQKSEEASILLKQQEEILIQQSKLATMGNMINIITHQWKQPLNTIGLLAQNLEEEYTEHTLNRADMQEYITNILKQINYMADTIEDFRNFFRPDKSLLQFDLYESVKNVCNLLKPILDKDNITVNLRLENPGPLLLALGYPNELKQVLVNLISNAKEAIAQKSCISKGSGSAFPGKPGFIHITCGKSDGRLFIQVEDNGGGIPESILDTLFHPYVTTKGEKGTGIGLYMAKFIIEKMNGSISANNTDNGALFYLDLPAV